ncbi:MAG: hypothetical protein JNK82_35530 [Myxococcaceae bacterium]|nr:hypothetical protein [Myxococcaceae bacterium]
MSRITSADLRKWETGALENGAINAADVDALKKLIGSEKLGADEQATLKDILQHDAFESKAVRSKVQFASTEKPSPVLGKEVANGVFVKQSYSPVEGHRTKEQALAAARMSGADNAMAVKDRDGRWHAVAATKPVKAEAAKAGVATLHDCPPAAYASMHKAAMAETDFAKKEAQLKKLASITYGVPEDDIKVLKVGDAPEAGKINISLDKDMQGAGQLTSGCNCGKSHENFNAGDKDKKYAVTVRADQLADPKKAAGVMFHELTHAEDYRRAQDVYAAYAKANPKGAEALSKLDFASRGDWQQHETMAAAKPQSDLQKWVLTSKDPALSKLSEAEKMKAIGYITNQHGATEATAYTKSFMQEFRASVKELGSQTEPGAKVNGGKDRLDYWDKLGGQLTTWASAQKRGSVALSTASLADIKKELKAFYATLTPDEQKRFGEVMTYIKNNFKGTDAANLNVP